MVNVPKGDVMATRRVRQIMRNRRIAFEEEVKKNRAEAKKIVKRKKKEDK